MIYAFLIQFLVSCVAIFIICRLSKELQSAKETIATQDTQLFKYEQWHRTWQLASPQEAAKLKPPLIPHKSYRKAHYAKLSERSETQVSAANAKVAMEDYTDGIVYPLQWQDKELEWNKGEYDEPNKI